MNVIMEDIPIKLKTQKGNLELVIEKDLDEVGYYLYVFRNGECINDYLQDTLILAKEFARDKFGVLENNWTPFNNSG